MIVSTYVYVCLVKYVSLAVLQYPDTPWLFCGTRTLLSCPVVVRSPAGDGEQSDEGGERAAASSGRRTPLPPSRTSASRRARDPPRQRRG